MIEVKNVCKKYRTKTILNNVNFTVEPGDYVAIIGTNGCGKSTLLKILSGSIKPDSGKVSYFGHDLIRSSPKAKSFCGYVPQGNPLMEELSVEDNLKLWELKKNSRYNVIKEFSLQDMLKMQVSKLSGGMKRRLSIACAIVNMPSILLLDEPTAALDLYYQSMIRQWLDDYSNANGTIIMVTHEAAEIMRANKKLFMKDGNLIRLDDSITMDNITNMINGGNENGNTI